MKPWKRLLHCGISIRSCPFGSVATERVEAKRACMSASPQKDIVCVHPPPALGRKQPWRFASHSIWVKRVRGLTACRAPQGPGVSWVSQLRAAAPVALGARNMRSCGTERQDPALLVQPTDGEMGWAPGKTSIGVAHNSASKWRTRFETITRGSPWPTWRRHGCDWRIICLPMKR